MNLFVLKFVLLIAIAVVQGNNKFITWNTNGARWSEVLALMDRNNILCIQEAGVLPRNFNLQYSDVDFSIVDVDSSGGVYLTEFNGGVQPSTFVYNNERYYMYYYDRPIVGDTDRAEAMRKKNRDTSKQNLAIITHERASHVYIFPPHSRNPDRVDVNRPIIGVSLPGYMVFTTHSDPEPAYNEINESIQQVSRFMTAQNPQQKWILMGDFNFDPSQILLPSVPSGSFISMVVPAQITKPNSHGGTIIDHAVYGGPTYGRDVLYAQTLVGRGSDHLPVAIGTATVMG